MIGGRGLTGLYAAGDQGLDTCLGADGAGNGQHRAGGVGGVNHVAAVYDYLHPRLSCEGHVFPVILRNNHAGNNFAFFNVLLKLIIAVRIYGYF